MEGREENKVIHIAIIPDGNRRWAKKNNKSIYEAYEKGIRKFFDIAKWANDYDIRVLSAWGFSTENFKRSEEEKSTLHKLFLKFLDEALNKFKNDEKLKKIRVNFFGRIHLFPKDIQERMKKLREETKNNKPYTVNLMMAYGGRAEIVDAINKLIKEGKKEISEKEFEDYLYTFGLPDPDIIIRTGGEKRTSGYMPWQSVYSELIFIEKLWPDFEKSDFENAIKEFKSRKRRFGK